MLFAEEIFEVTKCSSEGVLSYKKKWAEVGGRKRGVKTPARSIVIILRLLRPQQVKSSVSEKNY